ncbi:hypothetical protein ABJ851_004124, partial [Shigella flexneri]|nr:hypothetical protein [Escherichia coli]
ELKELLNVNKVSTKDSSGHAVIGLRVVQALDENFDYVKNLKYTDAMRIVHSWFGDMNVLFK